MTQETSDAISVMLRQHAHNQEILAYLYMVGTGIILALYAWGWWSGRWRP